MAKAGVGKVKRKATRKRAKSKTVRWIVGCLSLFFVLVVAYLVFQYTGFGQEGVPSDQFSTRYSVRGIDLSHHNEVRNWRALRDKEVSFVYLKATEGVSHRDKEYLRNYQQAKRNDLKVGSYHFFSFRTAGQEQAEHFVRQAVCQKGDLLPAIDVEHSSNNHYQARKSDREKIVERLKELEKAFYDHYGRHPVIYTNRECYDLYVKNHFPENPIWMCDLKGEPDAAVENWVIWQFSHHGKIPGISGELDLNYYRYSFEKFERLLL